MGIKNPTTFGDFYWAKEVEAKQAFDEGLEQLYAPYFAGVLNTVSFPADMPPALQTFLSALAAPPSAGFGGFALGVGVEMIDETLHTLMGPMMKIMSRGLNRGALETWLTPNEGNTLFRRGKIQEDFWTLITSSEGYDPLNAKFLYQSQSPYPTIPEIVLWARYHGDVNNVWSTAVDKIDIDATDWPLWEWLTQQRLTTEQAQSLFKRDILSEPNFIEELARIGWNSENRNLVFDLSYTIPNAMLMVQGGLYKEFDKPALLRDISKADIHPDYAEQYLDAVLTKPSPADIIAFQLRQNPNLSNLDRELRKIGIHPDYTSLYSTLAFQIPPVADIITMAVREAFSPSVAEKFGQYEDFPPDFEKYAAMKGLDAEWAKRYWAAHWALPSPQQGFEMLHRGVITEDELDLLLRALDVMPFWRDKLKNIAFNPLTRVDVRRMYKEGVLDEGDVFAAYLELGYSETNAERMSEFTIKQTLSTLSKFTSTDIVKAYTQRMIDKSDALSLLKSIGIRAEDANYIVETADYKREWNLTDEKIKGIKNLYKKKVYDDNQTRAELNKLNLPADEVNVLMEQWYFEAKADEGPTWTTSQTLSFLKKNLITSARAKRELELIGYDTEHVEVYIKSV